MAVNRNIFNTNTNSSNTLLISEVLDKVHKAKTKADKLKVLQTNDSAPLRMVIKSSFDPKIEWILPKGEVPFKANDVPAGTEHTRLHSESRKLYRFIKGGDADTPQYKKELMFVQMLEGLHESEARMLVAAKEKSLHKVYKGLSKDLVKQAFNWNEDFNRIDG